MQVFRLSFRGNCGICDGWNWINKSVTTELAGFLFELNEADLTQLASSNLEIWDGEISSDEFDKAEPVTTVWPVRKPILHLQVVTINLVTIWSQRSHRIFCSLWISIGWNSQDPQLETLSRKNEVARLAGIEPTTLGFGGQYSIHWATAAREGVVYTSAGI